MPHCGCHTMLRQPKQRTVWNLTPTNGLVQAGQDPLTKRILPKTPKKIGLRSGRNHIENIITRNNHPDSATHKKKIIVIDCPSIESKKSLIRFLYEGQCLLKSKVKILHFSEILKSRSISLARYFADSATSPTRRETSNFRSIFSENFLVS